MHPDDVECGFITIAEDGSRQRCTVKPVDHRGPHWSQVEPIDCDHAHFCPGHKES